MREMHLNDSLQRSWNQSHNINNILKIEERFYLNYFWQLQLSKERGRTYESLSSKCIGFAADTNVFFSQLFGHIFKSVNDKTKSQPSYFTKHCKCWSTGRYSIGDTAIDNQLRIAYRPQILIFKSFIAIKSYLFQRKIKNAQ